MELKEQKTYKLVGKDGCLICTVAMEFCYGYDDNILLGGEVDIMVSHQSKKYNVVSTSIVKDYFDFEWSVIDGKCLVIISDFILSPEIRGKGVGSFIWHKIFSGLPKEIRQNMFLRGKLVVQDSSPERDRLWKKLINYGVDPRAHFHVDSKGKGAFKGVIHDIGRSFEKKIDVI